MPANNTSYKSNTNVCFLEPSDINSAAQITLEHVVC